MLTGIFVSARFPLAPLTLSSSLSEPDLPYNATAVVNVPQRHKPQRHSFDCRSRCVLSRDSSGVCHREHGYGRRLGRCELGSTAVRFFRLNNDRDASTQHPVANNSGLAYQPHHSFDLGSFSISSNANCPVDSPAKANCSPYALIVPASNPNVGVFTSSGVTYVRPPLRAMSCSPWMPSPFNP